MDDYDVLPHNPTVKLGSFTVKLPDEDIQEFKQLLHLSRLGPQTYENQQSDERYGVSYEWMQEAKSYWETKFDWRACEKRINCFPNFKAQIEDDDGEKHAIHFVAVFSKRKDAIPVMFTHGWPGSFLEFLDLFSVFMNKYSSQDLPYHLIAPSLPGYTFSSGPPPNKEWDNEGSAQLLHKLMMGLGFGSGYGVQGGDIGSYTSRVMAIKYDECKTLHLNFNVMAPPKDIPFETLDAEAQESVTRAQKFLAHGSAYAVEQGTRPATIGFVLSSSPLAVLAWVGEKFLSWTDTTPPLDKILESVTLYYLTDTFPRAIYPYRQSYRKPPERYYLHSDPEFYCHKPFGFSFFPREIYPVPKQWIETTGNLVFFKKHDAGGHFAALEQPKALAEDVEEFLAQVWKKE